MRTTFRDNHAEEAAKSQQYAEDQSFFMEREISSPQLSSLIDYKIAQDRSASRFVYFGSQNPSGIFPNLVLDVISHGISSPFYGCVLCPISAETDRFADGNKWEPYKNKAFWAGAMDKQRFFYLLTDIAWYYNKGVPNPESGTCIEILWLLDNGYAAYPDPLYPKATIFVPPKNPGIFSMIKHNPEDNLQNTTRLRDLIQNILSTRNTSHRTGNVSTTMPHHVDSSLLSNITGSPSLINQRFFSSKNSRAKKGARIISTQYGNAPLP